MKCPQLIQSFEDIIDNIRTVEGYLSEYSNEDDFNEMAQYIKKGRNLLCYKNNGEYYFIPSRFIGYKNNSLIKHYRYKKERAITAIDKNGTSTLLNKLFGHCKSDDKLDGLFKKYCASLQQIEENRERKYWLIPSELEKKMNIENYDEGGMKLVIHKRRERNKHARDKCIQLKGTTCYICDVNLVNVYGEIAKDYIQVHHIVPLSQRKTNYKIDPIKDLIPVCPNCHAMLHRISDGRLLRPDELKLLIENGKKE